MTPAPRRGAPAVASRSRRVLHGLGAFTVLIVIVIGTPALLISLRTIPAAVPSLHQVGHTLTSRDDGTLTAVVFASVAWICWSLFTLSLLTELVARLTHRRSVHLPGLGGFQRPAAALLTLITVAFTVLPSLAGASTAQAITPRPSIAVIRTTVASGTVTAAPAPQRIRDDAAAGDAQADRGSAATVLPTYTVRPRDEVWGLAQTHLGNPLRYTEILDLNRAVIPATDDLVPGTVLRLPADAQHLPGQANSPEAAAAPGTVVTVEAGDTLTGIEQHVTGTPDWSAGWDANQGRAEPGGAHYDNPDLLRPGWTLNIPAAPSGTAAHTALVPGGSSPDQALAHALTNPGSSPVPAAAKPTAPVPTVTPAATTPTAPAPPAPIPTSPTGPAGPAAVATAPATVPTEPASGAPALPVAAPRDHHRDSSTLLLAFTGGGGLLLAGVALQAVSRYRRAQFRERRPGRVLAPLSPEGVTVERSLLNADPDSRIDVNWYRDAMTGLTHALRNIAPEVFPDVIAARVSSAGIELVLLNETAQLPPPWMPDPTGRRWMLPVSATPLEHPLEAGTTAFPLLVSIGYTDAGDQWLLDLERAGTIALVGDTERCVDLARFIAAEVAHTGWALDTVHAYLAGIGGELPPIDPGRLHYAANYTRGSSEDPGPLDTVRSTLESHLRAMNMHGLDVFDARVRSRKRETFDPALLMLAPRQGLTDPNISALIDAINHAGRRTSTAVILTDDRPGPRFTLRLDADATLHIADLGLTIRAQQLPAGEASAFASYLTNLQTTQDRAAQQPESDRPWDKHIDVLGALAPWTQAIGRDDRGAQQPRRPTVPTRYLHLAGTPAPAAEAQVNSVLPFATSTYLQTTAATEQDLELLAPIVTDALTELVEHADRGLDADLAAWRDPASELPRLTLLGPVEVRAPGRPPAKRIAFHTEVIAYFATRTGIITIERFADEFWPHDPEILSKSTPRTAISNCRLWLGPAYLPEATDLGYRIQGMAIDAELFRRLRARGAARGSNGIADMQAALDLVTGPPMSHGRPKGYLWLAANRLDDDYRAMVVDVAHTLATHYLAVGDPDSAYDAAKVAELAGSTEDTPLIDLVYACDAQGRNAEAEATVARLLLNYSVDIEEDLPKRTADLLLRRDKYRRH